MQLFASPTSPYVRKVLIIAHELGIASKITVRNTTVLPTLIQTEVAATGNPLAKIPTLLPGPNQDPIFDSRVIAQYFDSIADTGKKFIPPIGSPHRFDVLTREAIGDGILDAALLLRYEGVLRPQEKRWDEWTAGQMGKIERSLALLEGKLKQDPNAFSVAMGVAAPLACDDGVDVGVGVGVDLGSIAIAVACFYLDFRFGDMQWRSRFPLLSEWSQRMGARESFQLTAPEF